MLTGRVIPGKVFRNGERISRAGLNLLGTPSMEILGYLDKTNVPLKLIAPEATDFAGDDLPELLARAQRADGQVHIKDPLLRGGCIIDVKAFGAIGDGNWHYVEEWITKGVFANLAEIQAYYPWVVSVKDSIDWAACQKALDYAWQQLRNSFGGGGHPSPATAACVFFSKGLYMTNKTLLVPPKVFVRGVAQHESRIWYDPATEAPDVKWTNAHGSETSLAVGGIYAAMSIRRRSLVSRLHVWDGVVRDGSVDDAYNATTTQFPYAGGVSHMMIGMARAASAAIYGSDMDLYTFRKLHLNGYSATGRGTDEQRYGIVCSTGSGAGNMECGTIENNFFEALDTAMWIDGGTECRIANNLIGTCARGLAGFILYDTHVVNNIMNSMSTGYVGKAGIDHKFINSVISGNLVDNFKKGIYVGGGNISITGNAIIMPQGVELEDGYMIHVAESTLKCATGKLRFPMAYENAGINLVGNTLNFHGTAPSMAEIKPIYIQHASPKLVGGMAVANGRQNENLCIYKGVGGMFQVLDAPMLVADYVPYKLPDFVGQMWLHTGSGIFYVATSAGGEVASGAIAEGVTYAVNGTTGDVTYNGTSMANGGTFVGVSGVTTYTATGDMVVITHPLNVWKPINFESRRPVKVLPTVAGPELYLSLDESAQQLQGMVKAQFGNEDQDCMVCLPPPASCAGRNLSLVATKQATAGARTIFVLCKANAASDRLTVLVEGGAAPVEWVAITGTTGAAKTGYVGLECDGTYWYLSR